MNINQDIENKTFEIEQIESLIEEKEREMDDFLPSSDEYRNLLKDLAELEEQRVNLQMESDVLNDLAHEQDDEDFL